MFSPAFPIFILKFLESLQNYWHRVTDITSFGKRLVSSSGHTRNFCTNGTTCIAFQEYVSKGITHSVFYGIIIYKLMRFKRTANFISSGSEVVKRLWRWQYYPVIIEKTICLALGPSRSTTLNRLQLKHCTLTNKVVGTIWRALSKPPQTRLGPDPHPLWVLVRTPSSLGH